MVFGSILSLLLVPGCSSYEDLVQSRITRTDTMECRGKPSRVYLFFEGEPINFNYKRVGLVEVRTENQVNRETMLNRMKYEAWQNCADGIINIKEEHRFEPYTYYGGRGYYNRTYYTEVWVYTGIAVRINRDPVFIGHYGQEADTTFVQIVKNQQRTKVRSGEQVGAAVAGLAVIVVLFLLFAH